MTDWATYLKQFADPPPFYAELAREAGGAHRARRAVLEADVSARFERIASVAQ